MLAVAKNEGVLSPSASPRTLKSDADVASALLALATGRSSEPPSIQTHATYTKGHGAVAHMAMTEQVSQSMRYGYYYMPMMKSGAGAMTQQPSNDTHPSIQSTLKSSEFSMGGSTTPGNRQSSADNEILPVQHNLLLDMSTTQFNRFLKRCQLDADQIAELRKERRRKKNRLYAKRSRGKKLLRMLDEKTSDPAASDKYSRIIIPDLRPSQSNSESEGSASSP